MALLELIAQHTGLVAAAVAGLYLVRVLWRFNRLRPFGGSVLVGLSDWPHSVAMMSGRLQDFFTAANAKYGPIARIAPNLLVTDSPDVWMHVNREPGYKRSDWWYHAARIEHRRDNVFSETNNEKHDRRRMQMMPGYSGRENLALEGAIDECVESLLGLLRSKYLSTTARVVPVDLARKVQYFTLDVISGVGLGKTFGMLRRDEDVHDYIESSEQGIRGSRLILSMGLAWLAQAPGVGRLILPSAGDSSGFGRMMRTCFEYVDERAASATDKRSDMLASFIRHGLEGDELRSEALEQIIAGSDTTAGAIRGTLLHVMGNPRVYALLQREVDAAVRDGKAPAAGEGLVSFAQTKELPYLQAVVREGLRMWTPVASYLPRDVPAGGDVVSVDGADVFLPGGVTIGWSGVSMNMRRDIFGEDSHVFRPERWFEPDEARLARMRETSDLTFGHGKWRCLGRPVAQIEIGKVIFEMLRNFDIAMIDATKPWKTENANGLFLITDMWVQVMAR
jgi:cytochrome P450